MEGHEEIIKSAFSVYRKYYLRALLLEIFGKNNPASSNQEIKDWLFDELRKEDELFDEITMSEVMEEYAYLVKIGYFIILENNTITLTDAGIKALQECVWESLASTAFFGYKSLVVSGSTLAVSYQALDISEKSLKWAKIASICAGVSVLFALLSIVLTLCI